MFGAVCPERGTGAGLVLAACNQARTPLLSAIEPAGNGAKELSRTQQELSILTNISPVP
jgi:hypothetical protein